MAEAAASILSKPVSTATGQCFIDDEVLAADGIDDLSRYRTEPGSEQLGLDFWMTWPDPSAETEPANH